MSNVSSDYNKENTVESFTTPISTQTYSNHHSDLSVMHKKRKRKEIIIEGIPEENEAEDRMLNLKISDNNRKETHEEEVQQSQTSQSLISNYKKN